MKRLIKISAFLNISILYCLFLSFYSGNAINYYADFSKNTETEFCSLLDSPDLFCYTDQSESAISFCNDYPRPTLKNNFPQFSSSSLASKQLLFASFSHYDLYSKNLSIQFSNTDIVFPFHFFL